VPIVVYPSNPADDISGIWQSNITSGEIKNRNRVITFKQVGNIIAGKWNTDPFHKITGVREGDTIKFNWIEGSTTDKEGKWTRIDGIRSGKFDLEKIQ